MKKRPNIIITMMDDQRADAMSFRGHPDLKTPHLDKLAGRGTTFTRACHAGGNSAALCAPCRAMLHTGNSFWHMEGRWRDQIPAEWTTLGQCFIENGYHTHGIGKWHNQRDTYARSFSSGAAIFFGGMGDPLNLPLYDFDPNGIYDGSVPFCPNPGYSNELKHRLGDHIDAGRHCSEIFSEAAVDFLESYDGEEPYLLYVAFTAPHDPCIAPPEWHEAYPVGGGVKRV